jgi:hypothetical protein
MTNITVPVNAYGIPGLGHAMVAGVYTGDGNAGNITVNVGFTPKRVLLHNMTDGLTYEWFEGMTAGYYLLRTWATGVITYVNTVAGLISSNMAIATATEVNYPAPGAQSPDDGVQGTHTVSFESPDKTKPQLQFVAGASGAGSNVNTKAYLWQAEG